MEKNNSPSEKIDMFIRGDDNKKHIQKLKKHYKEHPHQTRLKCAFLKVLKDSQNPSEEPPIIDSGDNTWTSFEEPGFEESLRPIEDISHDDWLKAKESFFAHRNFEEVFRLIKKAKSHCEPKLIVGTVRNLIQKGICRERINGFYIHSILTPCNYCHDILLTLAKLLKIKIYVTYSEVYYASGKEPIHYEANRLLANPFEWSYFNKTSVLFYSY